MISQSYHTGASPDWDALLDKVRRGDLAAREEFLLQCGKEINRYATYRVHIQRDCFHSDTDDLVSEAIECILTHLDDALREPAPVAWLLLKAKYRILDYLRREDDLIHHGGNFRFHVQSLDAPQSFNGQTLFDQLKDLPKSPDERAEKDAYTDLYAALDQLSPVRRELICARYGLFGHAETKVSKMSSDRREQKRIFKMLALSYRQLAKRLSSRCEYVA